MKIDHIYTFINSLVSRSIILILLMMFNFFILKAQDKPAYKIFSKDGKEVNYQFLIKEVLPAEIIFFGEIHNNPIAHWLELELMKDLVNNNKNIILGMEMFEADNQLTIDEYLNDKIQENHFQEGTRIWSNYKTDYRPLVEFAKEKKIRILATNIPRRYANIVYRKGLEALDSLSDEAKKYIAPLPIRIDLQLSSYKELAHSMGSHGHNPGNNLIKSQAVKDATMAYFILKGSKDQIFHVNGSYHSQNNEGIIWFLKQEKPALNIKTIHTVEQEEINQIDENNLGKADFIICIPSTMTKTF